MRLLLLSTEFPPGPGGIGNHTHQLAVHLDRRGWEVTVVSPQDYATPQDAAAFRRSLPFEVIGSGDERSPWRRRASRWAVIRSILREQRHDLVVASGAGAVLAAATLCRDRPWVAIGHGTEFGRHPFPRRRILQDAIGRADCVICVSRYTREHMYGFGAFPRRVEVIGNGADETLAAMPPGDRTLADLVPDLAPGPVILTVGNLTPRKGQETVVRALPIVLDQVPDAQYVVVGLPTQAEHLRSLARELGVGDRLHVAGAVSREDLAVAYRGCDVVAMTSRHTLEGDFEGFGIAVIEGALFAKPAVVSNSGGLPEAVVDGRTGLIVPEDDFGATAGALVDLLTDPVRAAALGEEGRRRARRDHTWQAVSARYDSVLRSVLEPPEPSRDDTRRRLVFISDTPHYRKDGETVGWAATVREIDVLATQFDEVVHLAPLHRKRVGILSAPYSDPRVRLRFLREAGGTTLLDKVGIVVAWFGWMRAIRDELREDDLVHVRGPSNVALLALLYVLVARRRVHWYKYAGNWRPDHIDAVSYATQRWLLRHLYRHPITVNGAWPDQPANVHTFINPTFSEEQLADARERSRSKELTAPVRFLFVGRLYPTKGPDRALAVVTALRDAGHDVCLDLVGDGPMAEALSDTAARTGMADRLQRHGWLPRQEIAPLYAAAHFLLLASEWEGFPKVVSEAMAYGAVPLASAVSSIPQMLDSLGVGRTVAPLDIDGFVAAATTYLTDPDRWRIEHERCYVAAQRFSFGRYLADVRSLFAQEWGVHLDTVPLSAPASAASAGPAAAIPGR